METPTSRSLCGRAFGESMVLGAAEQATQPKTPKLELQTRDLSAKG